MFDWALQTVALLSSAILTFGVLRLFQIKHWLDEPDARSAHKRPMPTSGGIAMAMVFAVGVIYYFFNGQFTSLESMIFLGCVPIVIVGFIDDLRNLDFRWRLFFQFASAILVVICAGPMPTILIGPFSLESSVIVQILAVLAFVWLLNLFNFMDGIDGLAACEAIFVTLVTSFFLINAEDVASVAVSLLIASVALGFLIWNWPPAKIFMGDVGSNFLAYTLGALALISIANGSMNPWSWLLLLGVFVVDATYTLCYRILHGQQWHQAHNDHAYQRWARQLGSHSRVTLAILLLNCTWLAPLAWLADQNPYQGFYLTVVGYLPLTLIAWKLRAGQSIKSAAE